MASNVLVIGGGGREHALVWAMSKSKKVETVYCALGNAGIAEQAQIADVNISDSEALSKFIQEKNISLTIIGPEAPLVAGLADALRKKNHLVVGAGQTAAQLEGSKIFAKEFMARAGIPTAPFKIFDDPQKAKAFVESPDGDKFQVLKADGLAAGKGVYVTSSRQELLEAISEVMEAKKFGAAGARILLEEKLVGPEISIIALTDGKTILPFPASQDHKRVFDKDKGPNTGGMGAYSPTPFYDDRVRQTIDREIIQNFVKGLAQEKIEFRGIIYFGILLADSGPQVLEFNVRMGDPEAQVVIPLIESDLYDAFEAVAKGNLGQVRLERGEGAACTVVMASGGYPGDFEKNIPIKCLNGRNKPGHVFVFHAGTKKSGSDIVTNGGRVLNVTGFGRDLKTAVVRAYQAVKKIEFKNAHFRTDIAARAVTNKRIYDRIQRMNKKSK